MLRLQNLARKVLRHVNPRYLDYYPYVLSLRQVSAIHLKIFAPIDFTQTVLFKLSCRNFIYDNVQPGVVITRPTSSLGI